MFGAMIPQSPQRLAGADVDERDPVVHRLGGIDAFVTLQANGSPPS